MPDVWPAGLFWFFLPLPPPLLFCLASHKSIYAFGQLPSYLLLHSNCHRRLLIAQPHLVCHVCSPPPNILFSIPQPECSVYIESTPLTFSLNSKTEYITFIPLHFAHYSVNLNIGFSPAIIRLPLFFLKKNWPNWLTKITSYLTQLLQKYIYTIRLLPPIYFVQFYMVRTGLYLYKLFLMDIHLVFPEVFIHQHSYALKFWT